MRVLNSQNSLASVKKEAHELFVGFLIWDSRHLGIRIPFDKHVDQAGNMPGECEVGNEFRHVTKVVVLRFRISCEADVRGHCLGFRVEKDLEAGRFFREKEPPCQSSLLFGALAFFPEDCNIFGDCPIITASFGHGNFPFNACHY